jgi:NADH dehydrogenase
MAMGLMAATGAALVVGGRAMHRERLKQDNIPLKRGSRIVIVGGGFGGLYAAKELAAMLPESGDAEITLIDDQNYLLFTPMLTEVAGGELDVSDIVHPLQGSAPRVRFVQGCVDAIDITARTITYTEPPVDDTLPAVQRTLEVDDIILAVGSVSSYHGIAGLQEHSLSMKTLHDAGAIRNRLLRLLARADQEPDPAVRRDLLTIVVGGGGFTGVESMAAVNSLLRESAASGFPNVRPEDIRTVLVQPEARLLPELSADLAAVAQRELERRGVEVLLNTKVTGAGSDYVALEGGQRITTHALIWAGGVAPSPVLKDLACPHGKHGGLVTDACFRVQGAPGTWAIGDCAEIPNPDGKGTRAPTAQNATREGTHVAQNVVSVLRGKEPQPFTFTPIGELAIVGRRAGVAQVYGIHLTGLAAWAMWRMVYLAKIPDPRQRVRIFANWLLNLTFGRDLAEYPS